MKMNTIIALAITLSTTAFVSSKSSKNEIRPAAGTPVAASSSVLDANRFDATLPPAPWAKDDPADSLYSLARTALSRGDYKRASEIFHRIVERYPQSKYAGQSLYYEAFSLYRSGEADDLRDALQRLHTLASSYPATARGGDAKTLLTRVCGELAKRGDESCTASINRIATESDVAVAGSTSGGCPATDDENDDRISALNALLQMDADRAMPILEKVLARRDACSATLRAKAVFLVSQKASGAAADILMRVAQSDPDQEVREQAVFWLSQVPGARSVDLLETILKGNGNEDIKEKALFALSQHSSDRGQQILRDFASRESENPDLREKAIFWLGQNHSQASAEFLRGLYTKLGNADLKEKILFSLSQQTGVGNERWIMDVALNPKEDIDLRKKALFWAGQSQGAMPELISLYDRMGDEEMKEQLIFVYSQRGNDRAAVEKLFSIAKTDKDPDLRKKAIFWLGQSHDPRVQQFLVDLINK